APGAARPPGVGRVLVFRRRRKREGACVAFLLARTDHAARTHPYSRAVVRSGHAALPRHDPYAADRGRCRLHIRRGHVSLSGAAMGADGSATKTNGLAEILSAWRLELGKLFLGMLKSDGGEVVVRNERDMAQARGRDVVLELPAQDMLRPKVR